MPRFQGGAAIASSEPQKQASKQILFTFLQNCDRYPAMRLLNAETLEFKEFLGNNIPPYFILSHRWTGEEVTYKDFVKGRNKDALGYQKILDFCAWARSRLAALEPNNAITICYVWVDTCCIDKRSSAELSLAINSMYGWYERAKECCVYLSDVSEESDLAWPDWFRRGFTLQELLAPQRVVFVNCR